AHVPIGGGATLSPIVTGDGVSVVNNQLVENRSRTNRKEGLLYGLTGEIGAMFDSPFADNQRLRAYAGGYVYDRSGYDTQAGGRLGLEYQINDVLSLAGSRFTLGAELVYDKDDEFDAIASRPAAHPAVRRSPEPRCQRRSRLSAIQQRMDEGVRRDKGIRVGTSSSTTAVNGVPVINPATGNPFGGVYYADQAGGGTAASLIRPRSPRLSPTRERTASSSPLAVADRSRHPASPSSRGKRSSAAARASRCSSPTARRRTSCCRARMAPSTAIPA
ncbi:MAG: hypothetical protein HPM95_10800, partial [Alphaproteobacteria bacterium]|nr:hypothetical protein [Alphaproteobacteria bacterium]